jgi:prolyl-tRNA editing enzyme YbaK/EbsC (Cys-tRNA(Pro) deacylase)
MKEALSRSANRIQEVLAARGTDFTVVELPTSTRTAMDAAQAIGCTVAQIAKSLVFRTVKERKPLLVIASGVNRVNETRIADFVGEPIEKADAAYVRVKTGFAIGGVPPVGHVEPLLTIIDEDLMKLEDVWAAAGTPNSVFKLSAMNLLELTAGTVQAIR